MSLLLSRLGLMSHNHPKRNMSKAKLGSFQTYRSLVSENLNRLLESLKLETNHSISLAWMHECFKMLPMINNAFAKLMAEIEYPVSSWELCSIDEYLDYTINLLDHLNSISSSLLHARVMLMHASTLMERSPNMTIKGMKEMKKHDSIKEFKSVIGGSENENGNGKVNEREWVFHEAMLVMRSCSFWVCGVVLLGLKSDVGPNIEITRRVDSSLMALDSMFKMKFMEERGVVKEVEQLNECVRLIISSGFSHDGMELKRRLEVVGNGLKGIKQEEESLFGSLMAARNEVLETLRRNYH